VTALLILLGFIVVAMGGHMMLVKRHEPKTLLLSEYWVFQPGESMPDQEKLLTNLVRLNPYKQQGQNPVGPAEGLVLSDVRLHMGLILRRKNTHVFRPDLFDGVAATPEQVAALDEAKSLVKLRYVSEEVLPDKRHLQFLIHAADAVARLGGSTLIYDTVQQRMYSKDEMESELAKSVDATRPELHVRSVWTDSAESCCAETKGLKKIGLSELKTGAMEPDEQVLIVSVLDEAVERLWTLNAMPEEVEVEAYGDKFKLLFTPEKDGTAMTRILRVQTI
jgi:hypothetical protein